MKGRDLPSAAEMAKAEADLEAAIAPLRVLDADLHHHAAVVRAGVDAVDRGEKLPPMKFAEHGDPVVAEYDREMAILAADPRTAGSANRPAWLVRQVLSDAKRGSR